MAFVFEKFTNIFDQPSSFSRQSDRYYDEDVFINPDGTEYDQESRAAGVDNSNLVANHHVMRSRDNIYEYRDSPSTKTLASKVLTDTTSIRSPSSLAMTQKTGSQASLKSAISLKEANGGGTLNSYSRPHRSETNNPVMKTNGSSAAAGHQVKSIEEKRLLQREPIALSSTPVPPSEPSYAKPTKSTLQSRSITPTPSARTTTTTATLTSGSTVIQPLPVAPPKPQARTQVIEGVPQTSV